MFGFNNFFIRSFGNFKQSKYPNRDSDYISLTDKGSESSLYWFCENTNKGHYIVRKSKHWGSVGNCTWVLKIATDKNKFYTGRIYLKNLKRKSINFKNVKQ